MADPKLVVFGATWCGPSNAVWPVCKEAVKNAKGHCEIEWVDVDADPERAKAYRIEGIPTLVMLTKAGGELERHAGYTYYENIENIIRRGIT